MRNVSDTFAEKMKTHFMYKTISPPRKSCRLWDNVEKYGRAGQATFDKAPARCMLIPTARNTHSKYVHLLLFHYSNGWTNAPKCYVVRTLPVLFIIQTQCFLRGTGSIIIYIYIWFRLTLVFNRKCYVVRMLPVLFVIQTECFLRGTGSIIIYIYMIPINLSI